MVDGKSLLDAVLGAASAGGPSGGSAGGLGDILGQVLGGAPQGQAGQSGGGLGGLLGQVLGGGQPQSGGGLGGMLGQMLGGGQPQAQQGGGLGGLLGQILGGGAAPQQPQAQGGGLGDMLGQVLGGAGGASGGGLIDAVKNVVARNPTLAISAAGLLLGTQTGRGITAEAAKLGGVALIGGLAYHALSNFMAKHDATGTAAADLPAAHAYDAVASTHDGALKLVRAMIAAAMADGRIDADERQRITGEMGQAALTADQVAWLNNEMTHPATARQLADSAETAQESVEIYTSARIAIDDDIPANKAFLADLAAALQLPSPLIAELDAAVDGVKIQAGS